MSSTKNSCSSILNGQSTRVTSGAQAVRKSGPVVTIGMESVHRWPASVIRAHNPPAIRPAI